MKVFEIQNSFGLESLSFSERHQPSPGSGQVLIKVRAVSLNYRDILVLQGFYNPSQPLPLIPVSDGVGEVLTVGEGVTRVKVGDRVASILMQKWLGGRLTEVMTSSTLGAPLDGMLAEYVVLHEDGVVHVPDHLTDEEAATLPVAALTAWNAIVVESKLKAGDTVLVQGTGGVSLFALQFAKMMGTHVIVTSSSDEKLERTRKLGASDGINYKSTPEWGKQVREITGGIGVDHIVEVGGAQTLKHSLDAIRMGGYIALVGAVTGPVTDINITAMIFRNVQIKAVAVGHREMFEAMNRAIALNKLKPVVDQIFSFDKTPEAFRYMNSSSRFGKVCIRIQ